ncbi:MAG: TerB family tellurite resistance protein [Flavobacteriaceae bacterium]|nr:TerB family tellurite resistance protein [Flavobacteriaceae bacterium]MCY4253657.1 TerB family tellurite resistance protein [Flavobacteriaceae bacterium]
MAFFGLIFIRPWFIGAIIGYFVGFLIEKLFSNSSRGSRTNFYYQNEARNLDLRVKILLLAMRVAKVDGNILQSEKTFIRSYFSSVYGPDQVDTMIRTVRNNPNYLYLTSEDIAREFAQKLKYSLRATLLHVLFRVAEADGKISPAEIQEIEKIARFLHISKADYDSVKAMFFEVDDSAYTILEINPDANVTEIKQAYRTMAKKYHPDRIRSSDPAIKQSAKEKFLQIQEAYEELKKKKGF